MRHFPIVLIIGAFLLSACATATPSQESMMEKPTEVMVDDHGDSMQETPTEVMEEPIAEPTKEEMMGDSDEQVDPTSEAMEETGDMMAHDWFSATLINVSTDERFKIEDFKGKVILVETLAMW